MKNEVFAHEVSATVDSVADVIFDITDYSNILYYIASMANGANEYEVLDIRDQDGVHTCVPLAHDDRVFYVVDINSKKIMLTFTYHDLVVEGSHN